MDRLPEPAAARPAAPRARDLLQTAAAESIARIRHDRERVAERLRPLLAYLEEHVFDRGLDVTKLKKACGVRDNAVPIQFHSALGRPPHAYIEDRRLETAARLLVGSEVKIWRIAELVGYSSIQVFSRAFHRWSRLRPSAYRQRGAGEGHLAAVQPAPADPLASADLRDLPPEEAVRLVRRLCELYPAAKDALLREATAAATAVKTRAARPRPLRHLVAGTAVARVRMEVIREELRRRSPEDRRKLLRSGLRLPDPDLFELLLAETRDTALARPRAALGIARLAGEVAAALAADPARNADGRSAADLARAAAVLGHARRLAGESAGATEAIAAARRHLAAAAGETARREVATLEAAARRAEDRPAVARRLEDEALAAARREGSPAGLVAALVNAAAGRRRSGRAAEAIGFAEDALALARSEPDARELLPIALATVVEAHLDDGRADDALALEDDLVAALRGDATGPVLVAAGRATARLRLASGSEAAAREVLATLAASGDPWCAVLGMLELAALAARSGDVAAARRQLVDTALPHDELVLPTVTALSDLAESPPRVLPDRLAALRDALLERFPGHLPAGAPHSIPS